MDELRDLMNQAFDEDEQARAQEAEPEEQQTELSFDDDSHAQEEPAETETPPEHEQEEDEEKVAATSEPPKDTSDQKKEPVESEKTEKAPASWSARARESWGKLPKEAQAEVVKREKEINRVMQESATARRAVQELNQVLQPHAQRLMANGVNNPIQAIGTLLSTEGQLRQGDQNTKAQTIASLIKQYGVDIQALDSVLSNEPTYGATGHNPDIESLLNERLAPFQQYLTQQQQMQQMQQMQQQQQAQQSVSQFAQNAEFIEDVRMDMADLMDLAAARGQELTLEDAYHKACAMHPEVSKVMSERQRQQQMMNGNQAAQAKRNAAVSIRGQQSGQTTRSAENLRDQIAQAWSDSQGA